MEIPAEYLQKLSKLSGDQRFLWGLEHGMAGQLLPFFPNDQKLREQTKRQWLQNESYFALVKKIVDHPAINQVRPIALKGTHLIPLLYPKGGERPLSDIDLLVDREQLDAMDKILKDCGLELIQKGDWYGNIHKREYHLFLDNLELMIEVHTELYYHHKTPGPFKRNLSSTGLWELPLEENLLYLIGHWGFQHNFLKFFWGMDIANFIEKYKKQIDWNLLFEMAKDKKLKRALHMTLGIMKNIFGISDLPEVDHQWETLLTKSFLFSPQKNFWDYLIVKTLIKDNLTLSMTYYFSWIKKYLKPKEK